MIELPAHVITAVATLINDDTTHPARPEALQNCTVRIGIDEFEGLIVTFAMVDSWAGTASYVIDEEGNSTLAGLGVSVSEDDCMIAIKPGQPQEV